VRTYDQDGLKTGSRSEFTTLDSWNVMYNPHGLTNQDEISIHEKLYSNTKNVNLTTYFRHSSDKHIITIADCLQYLYVRDFEIKQVIKRIPISSFPK